jgi:hypothetical protein
VLSSAAQAPQHRRRSSTSAWVTTVKYFLVMEFVNGLDLGRIQAALEAAAASCRWTSSLHIGAEVCEALEHAHIANDRPTASR